MDALLGLERLLNRQCADDTCMQEIAEFRDQLTKMVEDYDRMLSELANLITDYEVFYSEAKVQFVGRKLKELKKEISVEKPAFVTLRSSIRLAYGT